MIGRAGLLAFVAGSGAVHCLPTLPGPLVLYSTSAFLLLVFFVFGKMSPALYSRRILVPAGMTLAGLLFTIVRADSRLADTLDTQNENKVTRVVLRVAGLPRINPDSRQFEAEVISSQPEGVPSRIQVSWSAAEWAGPYRRADSRPSTFPELVPGQVWRMALTLKKPHGARNPHAFDYESYVFAQGVRAVGSVRGTPKYMHDEPWASLPVVAQRARHTLRAAMLPHLEGKRYGAVLLALAIGDQASVDAEDWLVFNRTGITHLVSISGSHITMIAALGGALTFWLWRRCRLNRRALAERIPAQVAAAVVALLVAWLYCLLAGWGVPARRTFLMLAVVAAAYIIRMPLNASRLLCLVAFVVVLLDPWSLLASGFWLSFGAVCVLMASSAWWGRPAHGRVSTSWQRVLRFLGVATRLQLAITAGLMPLLALIFHEVSLASPFANAYAIPIISVVVTPLSLLLAGAASVPGLDVLAGAFAWAGHAALAFIMVPTVWLSDLPFSSFSAAAAPLPFTVLALVGLTLAAMPYGLPGRHGAWLLMMPALFFTPKRPPEGGWDLYALDVGQGSAIVIQTARHALLFDTGLRSAPTSDAGARIVWPFLRAKGIVKLDVLVVSHADIDHAGGVRSVLQSVPTGQSYSSFDLHGYLQREGRLLGEAGLMPPTPLAMSGCVYGMAWQIDGVAFEFLWPLTQADEGTMPRERRNDNACVLRIRGKYHSVLLPGDISAAQERMLVDRGLGSIDVVVAAHHGSKTSSSLELVNEVGARHVVAQVGAWNRYSHPAPAVELRWKRSGANFWRTDYHGAISLRSREKGLHADSERQAAPRYWQTH